MEREVRVPVFESDKPQEIQLIKSKLEAGEIKVYLNDKYMSFTTTPTATSMKVMVDINDEKKSFEIIDEYLKETDLEINKNPK
ncbi:DUF2007 domain-containing protein [Chryseobacterium suipulveris]|uniref:DUF2007 domain-containing protein n=1 Tax=Chryseobacterium suipulveris TaxID=2929800 RepID=A0ABY4BLC8_9FLAO|nr:DUF2007 domain-containing protein [Chryseobacterium suipulveris]UOE39996.1 DUF2007 domain-containing protein [Chryseobacterium suipulveris]